MQLKEEEEESSRLRDALEETIELCDAVSYQHDILLIQNSKNKNLIASLADKLLEIDESLLKEFDFSEIINDPC